MIHIINSCVGSNLRIHRLSRKMTVEFVSERLGIGSALWSEWEAGKTRMTASDMFLLQRELGINPSDLFKGLVKQSEEAGQP